MRRIDERITEDERVAKARLVENLPEELLHWYEQSFTGNASVEFYQGLLAGLTYAFQMLKHKDVAQFERNLEGLTIYISRRLHEMMDREDAAVEEEA